MSQRFYAIDSKIGSIALPAIPKCGQHTLVSLGGVELEFERLRDFPVRIAFVRCPVDRLVSCFSFFHKVGYHLPSIHMDSYEAFVDWALDSDDEHVLPQFQLCSFHHFKRRFPLSRMTEVLGLLTGQSVTKENPSEHYDVNAAYRLEDIKERYHDDFAVYEEACE
jgi:hypothetical protein